MHWQRLAAIPLLTVSHVDGAPFLSDVAYADPISARPDGHPPPSPRLKARMNNIVHEIVQNPEIRQLFEQFQREIFHDDMLFDDLPDIHGLMDIPAQDWEAFEGWLENERLIDQVLNDHGLGELVHPAAPPDPLGPKTPPIKIPPRPDPNTPNPDGTRRVKPKLFDDQDGTEPSGEGSNTQTNGQAGSTEHARTEADPQGNTGGAGSSNTGGGTSGAGGSSGANAVAAVGEGAAGVGGAAGAVVAGAPPAAGVPAVAGAAVLGVAAGGSNDHVDDSKPKPSDFVVSGALAGSDTAMSAVATTTTGDSPSPPSSTVTDAPAINGKEKYAYVPGDKPTPTHSSPAIGEVHMIGDASDVLSAATTAPFASDTATIGSTPSPSAVKVTVSDVRVFDIGGALRSVGEQWITLSAFQPIIQTTAPSKYSTPTLDPITATPSATATAFPGYPPVSNLGQYPYTPEPLNSIIRAQVTETGPIEYPVDYYNAGETSSSSASASAAAAATTGAEVATYNASVQLGGFAFFTRVPYTKPDPVISMIKAAATQME